MTIPDQRREERRGQRAETEGVGQRGRRQHRADDHDAGRGQDERQAGVAAEERDAAGADREDHQGLGGERLDEPARTELRRPGVEDPQHDAEGDEVEHRAERAEEDHEPADERDVPVRGLP